MAYIVMAYRVMAYIVMAYIVMAYIVMSIASNLYQVEKLLAGVPPKHLQISNKYLKNI